MAHVFAFSAERCKLNGYIPCHSVTLREQNWTSLIRQRHKKCVVADVLVIEGDYFSNGAQHHFTSLACAFSLQLHVTICEFVSLCVWLFNCKHSRRNEAFAGSCLASQVNVTNNVSAFTLERLFFLLVCICLSDKWGRQIIAVKRPTHDGSLSRVALFDGSERGEAKHGNNKLASLLDHLSFYILRHVLSSSWISWASSGMASNIDFAFPSSRVNPFWRVH